MAHRHWLPVWLAYEQFQLMSFKDDLVSDVIIVILSWNVHSKMCKKMPDIDTK